MPADRDPDLEHETRAAYNQAMRLGLAQINPYVGDVAANLEVVLSRIEEARSADCDLVVFPELSLAGYPPLDLLWRGGFVDRITRALAAVERASQGIAVILGAVASRPPRTPVNLTDPSSRSDGADLGLLNSAFLFVDGVRIGEEGKLALPAFDVYDDRRYFTPGDGAEVFEVHDTTLGMNVCEDLWVEDGAVDAQASLGASWVINVSASPFYAGKPAIRRRLAARRARENGIHLVYVNRVGGQDELVYDGGSFITGPDGRLLYQAPWFTEGLFVVDTAALSPISAPLEDETASIRRALVLGVHDYLAKNGFSDVLIGLSGGIDSALVAALAVEALGSEHVTAVLMPSVITSQESGADARALADSLGIAHLELPIGGIVEASHASFPQAPSGLAAENLQARVRGTLLMTLANQRRALVLATGNKSEIAVGYNTLYGDTVGALAPIGDLYKSGVYRLAASFDNAVLARIARKPPTAELRPGQRDEDDLPPYAVLDPLLRALLEEGAGRENLLSSGHSESLVDEVLARVRAAEYKRRQLPIVVKVSPKAFGSGRRFPVTHGYPD
jgi:NAD+ synthase (glutamine-hydrolysing)